MSHLLRFLSASDFGEEVHGSEVCVPTVTARIRGTLVIILFSVSYIIL